MTIEKENIPEKIFNLLWDETKSDDEAIELIKQMAPLTEVALWSVVFPKFIGSFGSCGTVNFNFKFKTVLEDKEYPCYVRRLELCIIHNIIPLDNIPNQFIEDFFTINFERVSTMFLCICEMFIRIVPKERFRQMVPCLAFPVDKDPVASEERHFPHFKSEKFAKLFYEKGVEVYLPPFFKK